MDWKIFAALVFTGTLAGAAVANLVLGFDPIRGEVSAAASAVAILFLLRKAGLLK